MAQFVFRVVQVQLCCVIIEYNCSTGLLDSAEREKACNILNFSRCLLLRMVYSMSFEANRPASSLSTLEGVRPNVES
jgi:hypothetical protein